MINHYKVEYTWAEPSRRGINTSVDVMALSIEDAIATVRSVTDHDSEKVHVTMCALLLDDLLFSDKAVRELAQHLLLNVRRYVEVNEITQCQEFHTGDWPMCGQSEHELGNQILAVIPVPTVSHD